MEPLNYSRSLTKQLLDMYRIPSIDGETKQIICKAIDLASASKKFILPDGGLLIDDKQFKALDENEKLSLPFPFIALEYQVTPENFPDRDESERSRSIDLATGESYFHDEGVLSVPKRIVFAREWDDHIQITFAFWFQNNGTWSVMPDVAIPRSGYLVRGLRGSSGLPAINFRCSDARFPVSDYIDDVGSLLSFLNALNCSNVQVSKVEGKNRKSKKIKSALPFDEYHILTIDVTGSKSTSGSQNHDGRHPREHLRRGHIRRLADSRRIWVNAAVINAGIGTKVHKDYRLRNSTLQSGGTHAQ